MQRSSRFLPRRATIIPAILVCILLTATGCGRKMSKVYSVVGEVFVDGEPVSGATITFCPKNKATHIYPTAVVGGDGSYHLNGYKTADGAPDGEYIVTIYWCETTKGERGEEPIDGPDKLGGRYSDPSSSPLKATVKKGKNHIPRFDLKPN